MRRRFITGVMAAAGAAAFLGGAAGGAGASPAAKHLTVHQAVVHRAATVNASALPRLTSQGRHGSIPLRRPSLAPAAFGALAAGPAADVANIALTLTPGTPLTGALGDQDNITQGVGELTPPDMGFAVGGTREVEFVNLVGRMWNGTTAGPAFSLNSFFGTTDSLSDPWVSFDPKSKRFFAGIFDISLGGEIIAVSQTSNPTKNWFEYQVQYPSSAVTHGGCPDQGKGGFDSNVVALGFNVFSASGCTGGGGSFLGAALEVFNKSQMLTGASVNFAFTDPIANRFSLVPAVSITKTATTERFASFDETSGTLIHQVTSTGVPPGTVTLSAGADLTVPAYADPPAATQPGTTKTIDSGDDRTQNVVTMGTKMLVTQTAGCVPSGDTTKRSCARVYEVNTGTSKVKTFTISQNATHFFYPAATFAGKNVAVSVGSSGPAFASLYATAGIWGQALSPPVVIASGTATNTTGRFGDYFAISPQPGNTSQFWVAGEIGGSSGSSFKWNTAAGPVTIS